MLADAAAMAHLHEVVDLGVLAHAGFADAGAVHGGVCLHLHPVGQAGDAGLHDLVPSPGAVAGKAEAIGADHHAVLQGYVIAQFAELAHLGVGVGEEAVADARPAIDHNVGQQHGIVADDGAGVDDDVGADVRSGSDPGGGVDDRGGMNAGRILRWLIEKLQRLRKSQVRIGVAQDGKFARQRSRGVTRMAAARVDLARAAYLELEMKVICWGPAFSMPATPVISVSGDAFCRDAPRIRAISRSFILRTSLPQQDLRRQMKRTGIFAQ